MIDAVNADRRRLLLALAGMPLLGAALVGCAGDPSPKSAPGSRGDVDVKVRWSAVWGERTLLALHAATVAAHPELTERLSPLTAHHDKHLATLEADGRLPFGAGGAPEPAVAVPDDPAAALAAVHDAEHAAAEARIADCLDATGSRLATVLASIAGSEAGHAGRPMPSPAPLPTWPDGTRDGIEEAQAVLAGEHACVYGYGVVGAHLPGDAEPARAALSAHRARRDILAASLRSAGAEPVAALSTYALASPVTDKASASQLAVTMEQRLAALYADLVAAAGSTQLREFAGRAVVDAAVQVTLWNAAVAAFPGLDGRMTKDPPG